MSSTTIARRLQAADRFLAKGNAVRALKQYREVQRLEPGNPAIYSKLIAAHQAATSAWRPKDFVDSLSWEMRRQELEQPGLKAVHKRLAGGMVRIGLTGGIGTGKSTVAHMFGELGWPIVDADAIVRQLLCAGTPTATAVEKAFGSAILGVGGEIDRARLARVVFADPKQRLRLERILHPAVRHEMERQGDRYAKEGSRVCLFDIPLLFESNYDWRLDAIVVVTCDEAAQLARCHAKFGWSPEETHSRIAAQLPLVDKVRRASFVIDNGGSIEDTRRQVEAVAKQFSG
ncbi:MAG: dephospho-CoA kinase [Deltaproteobacteria bacterium]|nr:dephospho-CoA kinase [Deltaproteobacteria bacterium]